MCLLNISIPLRTILYILVLLTCFWAVCLFMMHERQKRRRWMQGIDFLLFLLGLFEFHILAVAMDIRMSGEVYTDFRADLAAWPTNRVMGIAVLLNLICIGFFLDVLFCRERISPASVQESLDSMPYGLLYCFESGMPRLINQRMEEICRELFEHPLDHGGWFMEQLRKGEASGGECLDKDPVLIWKGKSGKIWSFAFQKIPYERTFLWEILASDITEEYEENLRLQEKNRRMLELNQRMKAFSQQMTVVTAEKETLAVKIRIHSALGESLIGVRRYLLAGDLSPEAFVGQWEKNLAFLTAAGSVAEPDPGVEETARQAGIELKIRGSLPGDAKVRAVVNQALKECVTNACRHAGGHRVTADCRREETFWEIRITNDGEPPKGDVVKGGGLTDLFRSVEAAGGEARIISQPAFVLWLHFERKTEEQVPIRGGFND